MDDVPKSYKSRDVIDKRGERLLPNVDTESLGRRGGPGPEMATALNPYGGRGAGPGADLKGAAMREERTRWHPDGSYSLRKK
jgi:hypothetical protein